MQGVFSANAFSPWSKSRAPIQKKFREGIVFVATIDNSDLHHPIATAAGIPCKFPVGDVSSVLKSP